MTRARRVLTAVIVLLLVLPVGSAFGETPWINARGKPNGRGYAKVRSGETTGRVRSLLGGDFTICPTCAPVTWVYKTGRGDPIAAVVQFAHGKVASYFLIRPQSLL